MTNYLSNALASFKRCLNKYIHDYECRVRNYPEVKRIKSNLKRLYKIDKLVKKMEDLL